MRILLGETLSSAADDRGHLAEPERVVAAVRALRYRRKVRQGRYAGAIFLLVIALAWWRPALEWNGPEANATSRTPASSAAAYPRVPDNLDFAADGTFDIPLAVVRSRCEMTVDEHVRPATAAGVWDASVIPGGSDLMIESDAGYTRHCLVGYNMRAQTPDVDWEDLTPELAAALCAERVGLDLIRWGDPIAAVQGVANTFSDPSAVVALRSESGLLAQCFMVKDLPQVALTVAPLEALRQSLCSGVSLHFMASEESQLVADGFAAWGIAPVRDAEGRLLEEATFLQFTRPDVLSVAVPVEQGVVAANDSWPLAATRPLADPYRASRLLRGYTVRAIDDGGRTLASEQCGG